MKVKSRFRLYYMQIELDHQIKEFVDWNRRFLIWGALFIEYPVKKVRVIGKVRVIWKVWVKKVWVIRKLWVIWKVQVKKVWVKKVWVKKVQFKKVRVKKVWVKKVSS